MKQPQPKLGTASDGHEEGDALLQRKPQDENWWPGLRRWHVGFWFDDATLALGKPESWN